MGQPVVHFEIMGADAARLHAFYSELFGWRIDTADPAASAAPVTYGIVGREGNVNAAGAGIGGGIGAMPDGQPGHVTFYVEVPDVEAALATAEDLGGSRLMGPDEVTDDLEIGAFADPEGHMIGVTKARS
jgi:predicted enzyme related to lactoylglutathione lyase